MTQKLYCYVDESGQDTRGILFVALAVVVDNEREALRTRLSQLEFDSGKGLKKWTKSTLLQRRSYVEGLLGITGFTGKSYFSQFTGTTDYFTCVCKTIAQALMLHTSDVQTAQVTVFIDGLARTERHKVGSLLRQQGIVVKKIRGMRDESDEFIRLADALVGFVRDNIEQERYTTELYRKTEQSELIRKI